MKKSSKISVTLQKGFNSLTGNDMRVVEIYTTGDDQHFMFFEAQEYSNIEQKWVGAGIARSNAELEKLLKKLSFEEG